MILPSFLLICAFLFLTLREVGQSLWSDELISWWVIKDSLGELVWRAHFYQGISPLFFTQHWILKEILGASEVALRIPSICWSFVSIILLFKIFENTISRLHMMLFASFFLLSDQFVAASIQFRPYSMCFTFLLCSMWLLRMAQEKKKLKWCYLVGAGGSFGLVISLQPLWAISAVCFLMAVKRENLNYKLIQLTPPFAIGLLAVFSPHLTTLLDLSKRAKYLSLGPEIDAFSYLFSILLTFEGKVLLFCLIVFTALKLLDTNTTIKIKSYELRLGIAVLLLTIFFSHLAFYLFDLSVGIQRYRYWWILPVSFLTSSMLAPLIEHHSNKFVVKFAPLLPMLLLLLVYVDQPKLTVPMERLITSTERRAALLGCAPVLQSPLIESSYPQYLTYEQDYLKSTLYYYVPRTLNKWIIMPGFRSTSLIKSQYYKDLRSLLLKHRCLSIVHYSTEYTSRIRPRLGEGFNSSSDLVRYLRGIGFDVSRTFREGHDELRARRKIKTPLL